MASGGGAPRETDEGLALAGMRASMNPRAKTKMANHTGRDRMPILPPAIEVKHRTKNWPQSGDGESDEAFGLDREFGGFVDQVREKLGALNDCPNEISRPQKKLQAGLHPAFHLFLPNSRHCGSKMNDRRARAPNAPFSQENVPTW
jgi:hypothetical protein